MQKCPMSISKNSSDRCFLYCHKSVVHRALVIDNLRNQFSDKIYSQHLFHRILGFKLLANIFPFVALFY